MYLVEEKWKKRIYFCKKSILTIEEKEFDSKKNVLDFCKKRKNKKIISTNPLFYMFIL